MRYDEHTIICHFSLPFIMHCSCNGHIKKHALQIINMNVQLYTRNIIVRIMHRFKDTTATLNNNNNLVRQIELIYNIYIYICYTCTTIINVIFYAYLFWVAAETHSILLSIIFVHQINYDGAWKMVTTFVDVTTSLLINKYLLIYLQNYYNGSLALDIVSLTLMRTE